MANLVGEEHRGQQHAGQHAEGKVVGGHHDHNGDDHDNVGRQRVLLQVAQRIPTEGADGHHDHHCHQRSHRDLLQPVAEEHHHQQQEYTCGQGGQTRTTAGFHVDDRLTNHRAAGHTADQTRSNVGHALALALAVLVAGGVGQVVDNSRGHHRLQQTDHGQRCRVREDDGQRLERQRHVRPEKDWQRIRQFPHITDRADIQPNRHGDCGQHDDAHQWRWDELADPGDIGK